MEAVAMDRQDYPAGNKIQIGKPGTPHKSAPGARIA